MNLQHLLHWLCLVNKPSSLPHFLLTCGLVLSKYQWTFCQATCLLEKILGISSLRNKDPMFRPNNLYSKKANKGKRWQWKPNKELAQYLQQLAFRKSNARRWQLILCFFLGYIQQYQVLLCTIQHALKRVRSIEWDLKV